MQYFTSLHSLRGLIALLIFIHHFDVMWLMDTFERRLEWMVEFFFVVSGFLFSVGYWRSIADGCFNFKDFIIKRYIKRYPLHIIGFVASLFVMNVFLGWYTPPIISFTNLLMLQSWVPEHSFVFSCNDPSWFMCDIFFCYAMFPLILRLLQRVSQRGRILFYLTLLVIYFTVINILPEDKIDLLVFTHPLLRLIDFIIGIALGRFYIFNKERFNQPVSQLRASVWEFATIALYLIGIAFTPYIPLRYVLASFWWIPTAFIIISFVRLNNSRGFLSRTLSLKPIVYFGSLSYAFYMIHWPVLLTWRRYRGAFGVVGGTSYPILEMIFLIIFTTIASIFIKKFVQDNAPKAISYVTNLLTKRNKNNN